MYRGETGPGYLSPHFGQSYRSFGEVIRLANCGLQILKQPLDDGFHDLLGVYPYAMCRDWSEVDADVVALRGTGAVALTFVADPFESEPVRQYLRHWDVCREFKLHSIVDLRQDWRTDRPRTMRKLTRRALEFHDLSTVSDPRPMAPELWKLYQNTILKHDLRGMSRLSLDTIERQLEIDGAILIAANDAQGLAGAVLFYLHGETANGHLSFLSARARAQKTSYALIYAILEELELRGCRLVNLGGAAGLQNDPSDGLARFKSGWANRTAPSLLCGKIMDAERYNRLAAGLGVETSLFFPSYRTPAAR